MLAVRPIPSTVPSVSASFVARSDATRSPPLLDRRGGPRRSDPDDAATSVDRFTASTHRPLPLWFAIGCEGRWALVTGVSISPHGVLLRALDPSEAALEAPQRDVMGAWRRLGVGMAASPLGFMGACIGARELIATLAARGSMTDLSVDLVPLDLRSSLRDVHMTGVLAPLADPAPHVLGVLLDDAARLRLESVVVAASGPQGPRTDLGPFPTRPEPQGKRRRPPRRR